MPSQGDAAQIRAIAEQVAEGAAEVAISRFVSQHPELRQNSVVAEIPAPLKWAAIITSAVITMAASGGVVWLVSSVSEMSVTLARMDERMGGYIASQEDRMSELERRTAALESYHRAGGR
ncbi:hypothetical protein [Aurantiacibacter spongiae]|uniref:Uncharacterized protein n=1 Tax=Aurantiacibacter spongiae TaxID=2488860 RepID=A0A3N5CPD6_9SPHN|nr:hypothetical protein [Aurantiacibacter spongiae]RPF70437.1 hypothetical protein EG799_01440 [Aurantiacibacter spongiae]